MSELRLNHGAAVPAIVESDMNGERPWFVMPWYEGGSLQDAVLDQRFHREPAAAVRLLIQLAVVLDLVHRAGYAHRDLKPANVLLAEDASVALTDFGLCLGLETQATRQTRSYEAIGSFRYIAPENEGGMSDDLDQRPADFYAYGKLAWALLAGREPPPREQVAEPANALAARMQRPELETVDGLIRDMAVRDLRARIADWRVVIADLETAERALEGAEVSPPERAPPRAIRNARRLRTSVAVEEASEQRQVFERRQRWMVGVQLRMREGAKVADAALQEVKAELGNVLSVGATTGGTASRDLIDRAFALPPGDAFWDAAPVGDLGSAAVCFVISSPQALESLPTFILRLWPVFHEDKVWVVRIPMVTPAGRMETVATFLRDVAMIFGPYPFGRETTVDTISDVVDETARLFVRFVDAYLDVVDSRLDPSDSSVWVDRTIGYA